MTDYRFVLNIYDGETLIAQNVGALPKPLENEPHQGYEMTLSHMYDEGEQAALLYAKTTITRTEVPK
jgi:hypothetical protein